MPPEEDQSSHGHVILPEPTRSPWWSLGRRLLIGVGIIAFTVLLVWIDRRGYRDNNDPPGYHIDLIDALYYLPCSSYADIARHTGMPIGSIGPTRQRTLRCLRRHI